MKSRAIKPNERFASRALGYNAWLDGLIRALGRHAHPAIAEGDALRARLMGVSGLAFAHYFFVPDDNWGFANDHPDRRVLWESLERESYGVFESLAAHLDRDLRRYDRLRTMDLFALAKAELEADRPVLALPVAGYEELDLVVGVGAEKRQRHFVIESPNGDTRTVEIEVSVETAKAPAPIPSVLTIRPSSQPNPVERLAKLQLDTLRWAGRHFASKKEIAYDLEVYFATGPRAYGAAAALAEQTRDTGDWAFLRAYAVEHADRRHSAADYLAAWATSDVERSNALQTASDAYRALAADLSAGAEAIAGPGEAPSASSATTFAQCWTSAVELERTAIERLSEVEGV